jgi:hypothetical protein
MPTYEITFVVVCDGDDPEEAIEEARLHYVARDDFEPAGVLELPASSPPPTGPDPFESYEKLTGLAFDEVVDQMNERRAGRPVFPVPGTRTAARLALGGRPTTWWSYAFSAILTTPFVGVSDRSCRPGSITGSITVSVLAYAGELQAALEQANDRAAAIDRSGNGFTGAAIVLPRVDSRIFAVNDLVQIICHRCGASVGGPDVAYPAATLTAWMAEACACEANEGP